MSFYHVRINYGPCRSFYTLDHKPQKIRGIKDRLQKLGYRVDTAPVEYENYCVLEMCGHEVFRCNINYLSFNTPHEYDAVAQRAVSAVLDSAKKFRRARSYLWFWNLLEDAIFRSDLSTKEYWPRDPNLPPVTMCFECPICNPKEVKHPKICISRYNADDIKPPEYVDECLCNDEESLDKKSIDSKDDIARLIAKNTPKHKKCECGKEESVEKMEKKESSLEEKLSQEEEEEVEEEEEEEEEALEEESKESVSP